MRRVADRKAGRREACRSASGAVWPPEAMSRSIQQAGSVQAAPRVGQAQSISQARSGEISTLSGVQSECVSTGPAKTDADARTAIRLHLDHPGGFLLRPDPVPGSAREVLHPAATTNTLFH
jgi:hypothetical protein